MGLTTIYGHQMAAAWDLGAQGPTTQQLTLGRNDPSGYPYDLSQNDDVLQLMGAITRIDSPVTLRERVDRGDIVFNYGAAVRLPQPGHHRVARGTRPAADGGRNGPQPQTPDRAAGRPPTRRAHVTPDVWFKLHYKALTHRVRGHRHLRTRSSDPGTCPRTRTSR